MALDVLLSAFLSHQVQFSDSGTFKSCRLRTTKMLRPVLENRENLNIRFRRQADIPSCTSTVSRAHPWDRSILNIELGLAFLDAPGEGDGACIDLTGLILPRLLWLRHGLTLVKQLQAGPGLLHISISAFLGGGCSR